MVDTNTELENKSLGAEIQTKTDNTISQESQNTSEKSGEKSEAKESFDIKGLDAILGEGLTQKDLTSEKIEDKVKTEVKVETKEQKREDKKSEAPSRNYEGFTEQEQSLLKQMSNQSFEFTTKTIRELKAKSEEAKALKERVELLSKEKQPLPDSYYQHPDSYTLSPEYREKQNFLSRVEQIRQHWETQAERMEGGEEWQDLQQGNDGQLYLGKPQETTKKSVIAVRQFLNNATNLKFKAQEELQSIKGEFLTKHQQLKTTLNDSAAKYFPSFTGDKVTEENKKLLEDSKDFLSKGGVNRDNPAFDVLSMSLALNIILRNALVSTTEAANVKKSAEEDKKKAGPNGSDFAGGSGQKSGKESGGEKLLSFEEMDKMLR